MPLSNCCVPPSVDLGPETGGSGQKGAVDGETGDAVGQTGLIAGASGSARWRENGVDVICAVHGPRAPTKSRNVDLRGRVECELRYAPYITKPRSGGADNQQAKDSHANADSLEKYIAGNIVESIQSSLILEKYPKMLISIVVNIQSSSEFMGLDLSASIVCASLALADASIEMQDLVSASSIFLSRDGRGALHDHLDLDAYEAKSEPPFGMMSVATMHNRSEICNVIFEGRASGAKMSEMIQKCCEKSATQRVKMESAF